MDYRNRIDLGVSLPKDMSFAASTRLTSIVGFRAGRRGRAEDHVLGLRSYIEAMGGRLRIVAEFPEGEIAITNFSNAGE